MEIGLRPSATACSRAARMISEQIDWTLLWQVQIVAEAREQTLGICVRRSLRTRARRKVKRFLQRLETLTEGLFRDMRKCANLAKCTRYMGLTACDKYTSRNDGVQLFPRKSFSSSARLYNCFAISLIVRGREKLITPTRDVAECLHQVSALTGVLRTRCCALEFASNARSAVSGN